MIDYKPLLHFLLPGLILNGISYLSMASPLSQFSQCLEKHIASDNNKGKESIDELHRAQNLCRKQLSGQPKNIKLSAEVINNLEIEAGFGWGIFSGNIYNANQDVIITKLIVSMTPIHDHHTQHMKMEHEPKEYVIETNLSPLSKGALSVALDEQDAPVHKFDWHISKAFGYKLP